MNPTNRILLFLSILVLSSSCAKNASRNEAANMYPQSNVGYHGSEFELNGKHHGNFMVYARKDPGDSTSFRFVNTAYPNPFSPRTSFIYNLPESCYVDLSICQITGKAVDSAYFGLNPPGEYKVEWVEIPNIPIGVYYVNIAACDSIITKKITLLK